MKSLDIPGTISYMSNRLDIIVFKKLPVIIDTARIETGECPSVCPVDRQQQRHAAGLLLSAVRVGDIDRQLRAPCSRRRRSAANAGSLTLEADSED